MRAFGAPTANRLLRMLACLFVLAMVASACGGDDEEAAPDTSAADNAALEAAQAEAEAAAAKAADAEAGPGGGHG